MAGLIVKSGDMTPHTAGSVATFDFELTHTYFGCYLRTQGLTGGLAPGQWGTQFGMIRLKINGAVVHTWDAKMLYQWCYTNSVSFELDAVYLPFTLEALDDTPQRRALGIGTQGLQSMRLEVEIKSPGVGNLTGLSVYSEIGANRPLTEHMRVLHFPTLGSEGAGRKQHTDLFPANVRPLQMCLDTPNLTDIVFRKGTQNFIEYPRDIRQAQLGKKGFRQSADFDFIDFLPQDDLNGVRPADPGYQLDLTRSSGSTFAGQLIGSATGLG